MPPPGPCPDGEGKIAVIAPATKPLTGLLVDDIEPLVPGAGALLSGRC